MIAEKAEQGKKYLTKKGIPVTVIGFKGNKVVLVSGVTGNNIEVEKSYELLPYDESKIEKDSKLLMEAKADDTKGKAKGAVREGSLAAIIDPMLFAGDKTVKEVAAALAIKDLPQAQGKDLEANVRARLVAYRRKGWRVEKDAQKRVRVIQK